MCCWCFVKADRTFKSPKTQKLFSDYAIKGWATFELQALRKLEPRISRKVTATFRVFATLAVSGLLNKFAM